jgi:uncharacterized protein YcbK (DUF882 family)
LPVLSPLADNVPAPTRQLTLVRPATGESARNVPFWWEGAPYQRGLAELNWLLRNVQAEQVHAIDLRVYGLLALLQAEFGGRPIIVTSGYRTKATNERLTRIIHEDQRAAVCRRARVRRLGGAIGEAGWGL